jgi:hypothetical protein
MRIIIIIVKFFLLNKWKGFRNIFIITELFNRFNPGFLFKKIINEKKKNLRIMDKVKSKDV